MSQSLVTRMLHLQWSPTPKRMAEIPVAGNVTIRPTLQWDLALWGFFQNLDSCDNNMFSIFPSLTKTLLSKQSWSNNTGCWSGKSIIVVTKHLKTFGNGSAVKWECAIKQPTLESLICVLWLPLWGLGFGYTFFSLTHTIKTNISPSFPTKKHRIYKPNQNRGTQMLAYCMLCWYVMTGWCSAHCQHYLVVQLNQLFSASCSFCSAVYVQFT